MMNLSEKHQKLLEDLSFGRRRVCLKQGEEYVTDARLKQEILDFFREAQVREFHAGEISYVDKIPPRNFRIEDKIRVVPPAVVRWGAYVGPHCVLMPCFVNIGAFVDEYSMIDTWATVGSCAQIGKRVHLSGGVGIGGVLEPLQAQPVVIEDDVFVGSRAVIVEGVRIGKSAVIGAGVVLTASTKIFDVRSSEEKCWSGFIPPHSVVIPGTRLKKFRSGDYGVPCALIVGERKDSTDEKVSLNEALREFAVPV